MAAGLSYGRGSRADYLGDLKDECHALAIRGETHKADSVAKILLWQARKSDNAEYEAVAHYYLSHINYDPLDAYNRALHLDSALALAGQFHNDSLMSRIFNMKGAYETFYYHRYYTAEDFFGKAVFFAQKADNLKLELTAKSNLSEIYLWLDPTEGLDFDLEIYDYAKRNNDTVVLLSASFHLAERLFHNHSSLDKIEPYLNDLSALGHSDLSQYLLGGYYLRVDSVEKSEFFIRSSLAADSTSPERNELLARYFIKVGEPVKAYDLITKASRYVLADEGGETRREMLKIKAESLDSLGRFKESAKLYQAAIAISDSMESARNRELVSQYRIIKKNDEMLAKLNADISTAKMWHYILLLIIVMILAGVGFYIYNRRKIGYYRRRIVAQNKEYLGIPENISESESGESTGIKMAEETFNTLLERIKDEVETKEAFLDPQLTRDSLAERLGCNRSYLSHVIKRAYNKNYTQYINSLRVRRAIKILSDPNSKITMQELTSYLGFGSSSTFYSVFSSEVGMPPGAYNKIAKKTKLPIPESSHIICVCINNTLILNILSVFIYINSAFSQIRNINILQGVSEKINLRCRVII